MLLQSHVRFLVHAASLKLKKSLKQKMSSSSVYHFLLRNPRNTQKSNSSFAERIEENETPLQILRQRDS